MRRAIEYLLVTGVVVGIAAATVGTMVEKVAQSMDDSANMIEAATHGR